MTRRLEHGRCEAAVSLCGPFSQFKGSFIAGRAWSLRRSVFEELRANRALLFAGSDSASWRDCDRVVTIFVGRGAPPYFERRCAISWPFQRAATRILGTSPMRAVPGTDCDLSATVSSGTELGRSPEHRAPKKIPLGLSWISGYITGDNSNEARSRSYGQQIPAQGDPRAPSSRGGTRSRAR